MPDSQPALLFTLCLTTHSLLLPQARCMLLLLFQVHAAACLVLHAGACLLLTA